MRTNIAAARPENLKSLVLISDSQTSNFSTTTLNNNNNNNGMRSKLEIFLSQSQKLIPVMTQQNQNQQNTRNGIYFKRISIFGGSQQPLLLATSSGNNSQNLTNTTSMLEPTSPAFPFINVNQISDNAVRKTRGKVNQVLKRKALDEERARKLQLSKRRTKRVESIRDYQLLAEVVNAEKKGYHASAGEDDDDDDDDNLEGGEKFLDGTSNGVMPSSSSLRRLKQQQLQKEKDRNETKQMLAFSSRAGLSKKFRHRKRTTYLLSSRGLTETEEERTKRIQDRKNISAEEAFQLALQNVHRFERDRHGVNMQEKLMEEHLNANSNNNNNNASKQPQKNNNNMSSLQASNFRRREFERIQIEQDEKLFTDAKESEGTSKLQDKALRQVRLKEDIFGIFRQFREERKIDSDAGRRQRNEIEDNEMKVPKNGAANTKKKSILDMVLGSDDDDHDDE